MSSAKSCTDIIGFYLREIVKKNVSKNNDILITENVRSAESCKNISLLNVSFRSVYGCRNSQKR